MTDSHDGTRRGFGLAGDAPLNTIREAAAAAEVHGYSSFWLSQSATGLVALAEAADATLHISLGAGVLPLSHLTPQEIAGQVRDLQMPVDRLLLGIGSGTGVHGVPRGTERVREGIDAIRELLDCRLIVAALGPKMCRLAGEAADGVLLNWLLPESARRAVEWVREGAASAGRPMPTVYAYVRVALGAESIARLQREAERYTSFPQYGAHFKRQGVAATETAVRGSTAEELQQGLALWDGVVDEVVVRALPAHDTVGETIRILEAAAISPHSRHS